MRKSLVSQHSFSVMTANSHIWWKRLSGLVFEDGCHSWVLKKLTRLLKVGFQESPSSKARVLMHQCVFEIVFPKNSRVTTSKQVWIFYKYMKIMTKQEIIVIYFNIIQILTNSMW